MAETNSAVKVGGAYKESDDHVPNPTDLYDQFNTSGTGSHHVIEDVSPIFDVAKRESKILSGRALDPNDPTPESHVVLPEGQRLITEDLDKVRDRLKKEAKEAEKNPVEVGGPSPSQRLAAEGGDKGKAHAAAETANQGTQTSSTASGEESKTGEHSTEAKEQQEKAKGSGK